MTKTANEAGLSREWLYKALTPDGNPSFATVCKIITDSRPLSLLFNC